jgi:hypothetical protein
MEWRMTQSAVTPTSSNPDCQIISAPRCSVCHQQIATFPKKHRGPVDTQVPKMWRKLHLSRHISRSRPWIDERCKRGDFVTVKVGEHVCITEDSVMRYLGLQS